MPIGKNAIKRVADSTKKETVAKTAAELTPAPKKTTAKKPAAKPVAPVAKANPNAAKPADKAAPKTVTTKVSTAPKAKKDGFIRIDIGTELPIYLL